MKTIFQICEPRDDVRSGVVKESDFAADLAQVLRGDAAAAAYTDPGVFFANTHPTEGLKRLLENVARRLTGVGGEASSIFRLDTQYGGGKTHSLIALAHSSAGMKGVDTVEEFLPAGLVPTKPVTVAAFDGENADPLNGRDVNGVRAFTPWGELAAALGGKAGYDRIKSSDIDRVPPGADTIRELFGGKPALILLDELSVYLRKVRERPEAAQLTPFLTGLFKAVESSPGVVLVFTLAIGKGGRASDAYSEENQFLADKLAEAESVAARKATLLDPTAEHETPQVLRRRLFKRIDDKAAAEVIEAYRGLWSQPSNELPQTKVGEDRVAQLRAGYPFHPALTATLTDKLSTLGTFQRVRGMLRLLTQSVTRLWDERPAETYAIHLHDLDPGFGPTRNEINTRLGLSAFDPAIHSDVAATDGGSSLAKEIDAASYAGVAPYCTFVARSILWNSFAFNEQLKGLTPEELRFSLLSPGLQTAYINDARQKFVAQSAYLDDRPTAHLRFLTEANLNQMVRRQEKEVDREEARSELKDRIRQIFRTTEFHLVAPFASGPEEVPDDVGDGRPYLVLIGWEAEAVNPAKRVGVPALVEKIHRSAGSQGGFRQLQNNVVFLVADEQSRGGMMAKMTRRLALTALQSPKRLEQLAPHQQDKVRELHHRSEQEVALAIQQCYRHLFYPSRNNRVEGAAVDLAHAVIDVPTASDRPGQGQQQVVRVLVENQKVLRASDAPLAPAYVRDQTPLKKGQITTAALRAEFRKDPRLPILLSEDNFLMLIRKGMEEGVYVYKSGELLRGEGDPYAELKVDENSFVFTVAYAKQQGLWPRTPAPSPTPVPQGNEATGGGNAGGAAPGAPTSTSATVFRAEAPLREALSRIWDQARQAKADAIGLLTLRLFNHEDAFKLLPAVTAVRDSRRTVSLKASYETSQGSSLELLFAGILEEAPPVREFLAAQFRVASDKTFGCTFELAFEAGLSLAGDEPEKLAEKLAKFVNGAALVEATAEPRHPTTRGKR